MCGESEHNQYISFGITLGFVKNSTRIFIVIVLNVLINVEGICIHFLEFSFVSFNRNLKIFPEALLPHGTFKGNL